MYTTNIVNPAIFFKYILPSSHFFVGSKIFTQKCRRRNLWWKAAPQSPIPEPEFEGNTNTIKMSPLKDLSMSATMIFIKLVEQRSIIVMMKRSFSIDQYFSIYFFLAGFFRFSTFYSSTNCTVLHHTCNNNSVIKYFFIYIHILRTIYTINRFP